MGGAWVPAMERGGCRVPVGERAVQRSVLAPTLKREAVSFAQGLPAKAEALAFGSPAHAEAAQAKAFAPAEVLAQARAEPFLQAEANMALPGPLSAGSIAIAAVAPAVVSVHSVWVAVSELALIHL